MPHTNILYLHSHDTGRMISPYGYNVPTPNLQRLAEAGVLMRRTFCAAPTCSPSRAAMLTGQSAHSSGMLGLAHRGFRMADREQHLVHTLAAAGYTTVLAGVQHVAAQADEIGYDRVLTPASNAAAEVAPGAVAFLRDQPQEPFFLDVGFFETHRDFPPTPDDAARYVMPPSPLPDTPATRQDMAGFIASARDLDAGVGQVLAALDEAGLAERTLVIYTTDHGPAFPDMKCNLTDHGIGVSLILRGPDGFTGGRVCDAMISHIDLFPTLCDYLDIPAPDWVQGTSFLPVIRGERAEINEAVFAEVTYHAAYEPQRAVRTQRYKYIRRYGDRRTRGPAQRGRRRQQVALAATRAGRDRQLASEQLYDLVFDPQERRQPHRPTGSRPGRRRPTRPPGCVDAGHRRPVVAGAGPRAVRRSGQRPGRSLPARNAHHGRMRPL